MNTLKMIAALMSLFWWPLLLCATAGVAAIWALPSTSFWVGALAGLFVAWSLVTWSRWAADRFKG